MHFQKILYTYYADKSRCFLAKSLKPSPQMRRSGKFSCFLLYIVGESPFCSICRFLALIFVRFAQKRNILPRNMMFRAFFIVVLHNFLAIFSAKWRFLGLQEIRQKHNILIKPLDKITIYGIILSPTVLTEGVSYALRLTTIKTIKVPGAICRG